METITDLWYGAIAPWETCGAGDKQSIQLCTLLGQPTGGGGTAANLSL